MQCFICCNIVSFHCFLADQWKTCPLINMNLVFWHYLIRHWSTISIENGLVGWTLSERIFETELTSNQVEMRTQIAYRRFKIGCQWGLWNMKIWTSSLHYTNVLSPTDLSEYLDAIFWLLHFFMGQQESAVQMDMDVIMVPNILNKRVSIIQMSYHSMFYWATVG